MGALAVRARAGDRSAYAPLGRYPRWEPPTALLIPAKRASFFGHPPLVGAKTALNSPLPHASARKPRHKVPKDHLLDPPHHRPGGWIGPAPSPHVL